MTLCSLAALADAAAALEIATNSHRNALRSAWGALLRARQNLDGIATVALMALCEADENPASARWAAKVEQHVSALHSSLESIRQALEDDAECIMTASARLRNPGADHANG